MKRLLLTLLASLALLGIAYAAEIEDLETTDANNTARFPENMAPSAVNNGARALEGLLARFYVDLGCRVSTAGSSNAYTFAASQAITSYFDGLLLCFDASFATTGSATLNVDTLGAKTIQRNGVALVAGQIEKDQKVLVVYDGTNFEVLSVMRAITGSDVITTRGDVIRGDSSGDAERLAVGNADEILGTDGTDAAWRAITSYLSTQGELEIGSAITGYTSPGRQQFHPSAAKAWVTFTGTGTPAEDAAYNTASITDNATGDYTWNITTDFSSGEFAVTTGHQTVDTSFSTGDQGEIVIVSRAAGTVRVRASISRNSVRQAEDMPEIHLMAFGDQ